MLFAGLSSAIFGVADFLGGLATRRAAATAVVWGSQTVALMAVAVATAVTGVPAPPAADLLWGAGAGIFGTLGLVIFYHALAATRMGVAAPVAAVVGTALPVLFGVAIGERPSVVAWVGILVAVPAIGILAGGASGVGGGTVRQAARLGAAAGVAFALFGILISRTDGDSGLWPLVAARVASLVVLSGMALVRRQNPSPRGAWGMAAAVGILDMTANVLFLVALRQHLLSLVAVIMAMYPATTIALARRVLGEEITRRQWVGMFAAALAVAAIAAG